MCESQVCLLKELADTYTLGFCVFFFLRIKTVPYLNVTVLATVKLNPVILALPAFLVLLGEGRHPAIIYTQG